MVLLTFRAVRGILVWPPAWWGEFIDQAWQMIRRTALPVAISTLAFGFGAAGIQAGQFAEMVGSVDRIGSSFVTATVREFAPWITGMVVGGVAGTAICADLGARRIREELDALGVLGVDPLKALVVPRFLALGVVAVLMSMLAIAFGAISGLIAAVGLFNGTAAGYFATFGNNFVVPELLASMVKTCVFGFIVAIVCCYKGLTVKGGPEGVGRAVNQAVVASFVGIWIFNFAFTSTFLAAFPETGNIR